jgi:hypothetical protein
MRTKLLIFFFFTVSYITGVSQKFNAGIIAGGLLSQVDGDGYGGFNKFGYLAGGLVSLRISPHSSFQMEIEYIQKGSRINADSLNNNNTYLMRFHYLEVPVLYQYSMGKRKRFSLEAGPAMDVTLGSYEESNGLETQSTIPLRNVTLAGIFGISGMIGNHLKWNFRYNYSLLSIRQTADSYPSTYRYILWQKGQFNNVVSFSLLYYFKPKEDQ